ncbi:MAG: peptidase M16 [Coxiella sp. RIFCSPHIGHO2_12_FULL_44_14]|nr:MAG: peptidase M16 [Coxiella sp. RIFCSPHIGHO2_12_FULL_44_14]
MAWKWIATVVGGILPVLCIAHVHIYHLSNGLTLIVKEDHRAPVVFSSMWYRIGSSYEHSGITGISHVLEHMMFRGTPQYPAGQIEQMISQKGGEQNAMTGDDQTVYYQRLSTEQWAISFVLEADRMRHLSLAQADFSKEIQVVMEERRLRTEDNPQAVTMERFMASAFVNNPYHHPTVGWMTDLQHMTVQDVRRWYRTWYAPNNAIVIVVGDVKPGAVWALAQKYFAPLKAAPLPKPKPRTEIAPLGSVHINVQVPAKLPLLIMGYPVPSLVTTPVSWQPYALEVLSALLGGSDSSRFTKTLIRGQAIASVAQSTYDPYTLYNHLLMLVGIPAENHTVSELKNAFLQQINRLQTHPVSMDELNRVKAQVVAQNMYEKDSLMNQAMNIGVPESLGLSWRVEEDHVRRIAAVTPEQIQQVAKIYLIQNHLTTAVLTPSEKIHGKK